MKKIFLTMAVLLMVVGMSSCSKDDGGDKALRVKFSSANYTLSDDYVDVTIVSSDNVAADLAVNFVLAGTAVEGQNYEIDATQFVIAEGTNTASVRISTVGVIEPGKNVKLTLAPGAGYKVGNTAIALVSLTSNQLVYNFSAATMDLSAKRQLTLTLTRAGSADTYAAPSGGIVVPLAILSGATAVLGDDFTVDGGGDLEIVIPAGGNNGSITLVAGPASDPFKTFSISVDTDETGDWYIGGNTPQVSVTVIGMFDFEALLGTWEHVGFLGLDNFEMYVEGDFSEDELDIVPTHNDGLMLTFSGTTANMQFTPGGTGDLLNLFRTATMTYCTPINYVDGGMIIDACTTSDEWNMFSEEMDLQLTYFEMSTGNRAFSATATTNGTITVAMRFNESGNLEIYLRDFDEPPFLSGWWEANDYELMGFGYEFRRAE